MRLKPFFSYYGSKWRLARHYPAPSENIIVEPFAGAAGYSLNYSDRQVILCDTNPVIVGVWRYLISASEEQILSLPDTQPGAPIVAPSADAAALIGFWEQQAGAHPRLAGRRQGNFKNFISWGARAKDRIASQLPYVRHWKVYQLSWANHPDVRATWFIDPPYSTPAGAHYTHSNAAIDFEKLGCWSRSRAGQVIVCEQLGANWLPFREFRSAGSAKYGKCQEAIWTNE